MANFLFIYNRFYLQSYLEKIELGITSKNKKINYWEDF